MESIIIMGKVQMEKVKGQKIMGRMLEKLTTMYIMNIQNKNSVWIGLATVIPLEGNNDLGNAKGAAVNVLHWAKNENDFREKVALQLSEYEYSLEELEDVELFDFTNSEKYNDDLDEKAVIVKKMKSLQWGTFYTFDQ
ncbi:MAG: hypothetical protein AB7V25_07725 [Mangrovibacterium sp.]